MPDPGVRERFRRAIAFLPPEGRLPAVEWAGWWEPTWERWKGEGLPAGGYEESLEHFGLDPLLFIHSSGYAGDPEPPYHGGPLAADLRSYEALRPRLFADWKFRDTVARARALKERHERGEVALRMRLDGYFWFPRKMLGIEPHFYALYDQPELVHQMNEDCCRHNLRVLDAVFSVLAPETVELAEDMSYNHGPMLSEAHFREYLLPYYRRTVPVIRQAGALPMVDSDGDVAALVPWLAGAGIGGLLPLERQAGVDVAALRRRWPRMFFLGGFDKMAMPRGEAAMRAEFGRLLPVMRQGGFVPSVDHQTPPGVSLDNYRTYVRLLKEYGALCAVA